MDNILLRIRAGESVNSLETLRNKKDGTIIDVSVTISPIIDDDGTVIGASSIARNITQRKTDEQLRDVEERYQSVVENIAVGVYRSTGDPKGKFLWGNPALVQILGYTTLRTLEEVAVADIFVEPDGREKFLLELKKAGFVKNRELLLRKPDGTRITVLVTALLKLNQNGDIEYISGLVEDITRRRQAEEQLQVIQKEILDVVEFLPAPTFIIDNKKKVVAWNRAIEQLTGVTRAEIIGTAGYARSFPFYGTSRPLLIDLIDSPDEDIARYYSNMKRDGATLEAEAFCPTLSFGKGATLWGKAAPLTDADGNRIGAIEIIHEVSDLKPGHVITLQSADAAEAVVGRTAPGHATKSVGASYTNIPALLSRLYLSNALKTAHDGITILDLSARCIWANDALITLVGAQDSDAIVGKNVTEFIVTDLKQSILDRLTSIPVEGPTLFPLQIVTASGPVRVDTSISGISDEEGETLGYMAIFHRSKTHVDRQ
jgi:PAS domain S-box-containing protein